MIHAKEVSGSPPPPDRTRVQRDIRLADDQPGSSGDSGAREASADPFSVTQGFGYSGLALTWYRFRKPAQYGTILAGLALGLVWRWSPGFIVVLLALIAFVETELQLRRRDSSLFLSVLLDTTLIGAGVYFVCPPHLALPVPFLANAATALMLLPLRRALWVWAYGLSLMLTVLAAATLFGRSPMTGTEGAVVSVLIVIIFSGQLLSLIWLLERAVREHHASRISTLKGMVEARDGFIASVSHELRTPMTAIVGFAHVLHESLPPELPTETAEMIDAIRHESDEVSYLVEDLLTQTRTIAGNLVVEARVVSLGRLAAEVARTFNAAHPEGRITVESGDAFARADPHRVSQIVRNLVSNAVRYGGPDITITVRQTPNTSEVIVSDDGPGIPSCDLDRVFRAYETLGPEPSQPGRLGLGLAISRSLARAMGGELEYTRDDGRTHFVIQLPTPQGPGQSSDRSVAPIGRSRPVVENR